jgi:hypothetical protein
MLMVAKTHVLSDLGRNPSSWRLFSSTGAGPALVVAHTLARATAAPLIYTFEYVVDDDDAKGDFYAWFGRSRDLLSPLRVFLSCASALSIAACVVGPEGAAIGGAVTAFVMLFAGLYGQATLGGVQGDFLGATICLCELALYFVFAACAASLPAGQSLHLPVKLILDADPWPLFRLSGLVAVLYNVSRVMGAAARR